MSKAQLNLSVIVVVVTLMAMIGMSDGTGFSFVVEPPPISGPGRSVLIVEESEDTDDLPEGQKEILNSWAWREGWDWRVVDPTDDHPNDLPKWRDAVAKLKDTPLPAYAISDGRTGETGALPNSLAEWAAKLAKYGGQP